MPESIQRRSVVGEVSVQCDEQVWCLDMPPSCDPTQTWLQDFQVLWQNHALWEIAPYGDNGRLLFFVYYYYFLKQWHHIAGK